jgi:hypothetical protein
VEAGGSIRHRQPRLSAGCDTAEKGQRGDRRAVIDGVFDPVFLIVNEVRFGPNGAEFHYLGHEKGGEEYLVTAGKQTTLAGRVTVRRSGSTAASAARRCPT